MGTKKNRILYAITEDHKIYKVDSSDGRKKYVPVTDYVERYNLLWGELAELSDKVDCFHKKNGAGFEVTRCCLDSYRRLAYGTKNRDYDGKTKVNRALLENIDDYDDAINIFEIIGVMGIDKRTARYYKKYSDSSIYSFMAVLTYLIEDAVEDMEQSHSKNDQRWAKLIRACWMDLDHEDDTPEELKEYLGYEIKAYYRGRDFATTALSKRLFGDIPGENGIHNFTTDEEGKIIFNDFPIKIRKTKSKDDEKKIKRKRLKKEQSPERQEQQGETMEENEVLEHTTATILEFVQHEEPPVELDCGPLEEDCSAINDIVFLD